MEHGPADGAEAEDAQGASGQAAGLAELFLPPRSVAQGGGGVDDPPVGGDHQADGQFGHGQGVFAGAIGHVDAPRAGGGQVDGVHARPGADNQRELARGLDRGGRNLGRADDENAHVGHGAGQRIGRKVAAHFDLEIQFLEFRYGAAGELIYDQDFHNSTLYQFDDSKPAD